MRMADDNHPEDLATILTYTAGSWPEARKLINAADKLDLGVRVTKRWVRVENSDGVVGLEWLIELAAVAPTVDEDP